MSTQSVSSLLPSPSRQTLAFTSLACLFTYFLCLQLHAPSLSSYTASTSSSTSSLLPYSFPISPSQPNSTPGAVAITIIPFCPANFTYYCPCQDLNRERFLRTIHNYHRERHCPTHFDRPRRCRVPKPAGYRGAVPWPESRRWVWFNNVPFKRLSIAKANQHWVRVEEDRLVFPGGGTSFPYGVKWYVEQIASVVPLRTGEVRTVLDIGCGVASFGDCLLNYNVLTMSVAPRDSHEAQIQFALERGLPAMFGVLSIFRLPYPSMSFDVIHCARCMIKWASREGLYLLEIDRILRPGGYWVLSGPPIDWKNMYKGWGRTPQDLEAEQIGVEEMAKRLCWKKIAEKGPIAVWRKPTNHIHCAKKSKILKSPPLCEDRDPDAAWYEKMEVCITPLPKVEQVQYVAGGTLANWPKRLIAAPPRISSGKIEGTTAVTFNRDYEIWNKRVEHYEAYINLHLEGVYRNVMDMNAGLGGFAAVLSKYPVWVMNTVPFNTSNGNLGVIYERGLIGTYMDWCEAFSTYPRTYDLIHANGIFSMYNNKCEFVDILLEMDRILRPEGAVIIRDQADIVVKVKNEAEWLGWQGRVVYTENGPLHPKKLLIIDNSIRGIVKRR